MSFPHAHVYRVQNIVSLILMLRAFLIHVGFSGLSDLQSIADRLLRTGDIERGEQFFPETRSNQDKDDGDESADQYCERLQIELY